MKCHSFILKNVRQSKLESKIKGKNKIWPKVKNLIKNFKENDTLNQSSSTYDIYCPILYALLLQVQ